MKTKLNIALIAAALTLGFAGTSSASTPGKHVSGDAGPHKHLSSGSSSSTTTPTMIKHIGPASK